MEPTPQIQLIVDLMDDDKVDDALEMLAIALSESPENTQLLALLGRLVLKTGALEGYFNSLTGDGQAAAEAEDESIPPGLGSNSIPRQESSSHPGAPADRPQIERAHLLDLVIQVCERFSRTYDPFHQELVSTLKDHRESGESGLAVFSKKWDALVQDISTRPFLFGLLFPDLCAAEPDTLKTLRLRVNRTYLPTSGQHPISDFLASHLVEDLTTFLLTGDPAVGAPFEFLSRYYFFRDLLVACFVDEGLREIQHAVFYQCFLQRHNWRASYASDYPCQGLSRIGISGIKPSEERLHRYGIQSYLKPTDLVLDIGSNNGFLALSMAPLVREIHGIEFNPYLVNISHTTCQFLQIRNAQFILGDFVEFTSETRYDVVLSLANHCTIDGNLSIDFELYIARIHSLLRPDGLLLFESHNVFAPGAGTPGDDGDLDQKFDVVERYFEIITTTMTSAYVPAFDIDKLFIALRRRPQYKADATRTFHLSDAMTRYANS
jgi:SAM-dependent methyltransferase